MLCPSRPLLRLCGDGHVFLALNWPDIVLVISYNLFMLRCPAAVSASVAASVARAWKNSFLCFSFLTSLFNFQYRDVESLCLACSLHPLISSLRLFLCKIRDQISFDSQYFGLFALLPWTSSNDSCHVSLWGYFS